MLPNRLPANSRYVTKETGDGTMKFIGNKAVLDCRGCSLSVEGHIGTGAIIYSSNRPTYKSLGDGVIFHEYDSHQKYLGTRKLDANGNGMEVGPNDLPPDLYNEPASACCNLL